jgi:hypothetical protein
MKWPSWIGRRYKELLSDAILFFQQTTSSPSFQLNLNATQQPTSLQRSTMFRSIIIFLALAVMAIATKNPNYCYDDGCKRTLEKLPGGREECKRNLACSVTPKAVIVTTTEVVKYGVSTITASVTTKVPSAAGAVSACKTGFPWNLHKSCDDSAASYTSACSCIKATGHTDFAKAPTVTATVIKTFPTKFVYA